MSNRYTIEDETYIAEDDRIYRITDEIHTGDEMEEERTYLYDGIVVEFDLGYTVASVIPMGDKDRDVIGPHERPVTATVVEQVIPDGIATCPECGGWFGPKDSDINWCSECLYQDE